MVRDLLAEVKHNAKIKSAQVRCQDDEFRNPSSPAPELGDDESREAVVILVQSFHSGTTARAVVARLKAYADDSPYSYSPILRMSERLAIKDFCGVEILGIIKSCGDVVAAINGNDADLADVVLSIAELKSTQTEGYSILSELDNRGIPVFNLLGTITGKTSDSIKQAALHNQLDLRIVYGVLLEGFDQGYGGLAHKVAEERKRAKRP